MSATILTRATGKGKPLGVGAPSSFIETMERAFGNFPVVLNYSHLERLHGMASVKSLLVNEGEVFERLIEEIEREGEIEVFAQY